jgi:hypothetical protein
MCGVQCKLKLSGKGQSKLKLSGNGNECKPLLVGLLRALIGEAEHLQNTGVGSAHVPQEDRAVKHVLEVLAPYRTENGGPLVVEHVVYTEAGAYTCPLFGST